MSSVSEKPSFEEALDLIQGRAEAIRVGLEAAAQATASRTDRPRAHEDYQDRPIEWIEQYLGIPEHTLRWSLNEGYEDHNWDGTPDPLVEMAEALVAWEDVGVEAGTGTQKSHTAACLVLWFLATWDGARVFTFAPKEDQLRLFIWTEIRKLWPKFQVHFPNATLTDLRIRMIPNSDEWSAVGYAVGIEADGASATRAQGMHCLFEDHEVLTSRGWLGADDVKEGDLVLSVPVDGDMAEWMPVTAVHRYEHEGPLNVYEGKSVSFAVTDEHRFPTKWDSRVSRWRMRRYSEMASQFMVRRVSGWGGNEVQVPAPFAELGFDARRFAEFVGFWIGDGGVRYNSKREKFYEVLSYQTRDDGGYLESLLAGTGWTRAQDYYAFCNEDVANWLIEHVGRYQEERRVPAFLKNATPDVLNALVEGLWQSDGTHDRDGRKRGFYTTSRGLADDVQEILLKLGRPATLGINRKAGSPGSGVCSGLKSKHDLYCIAYPHRPSDHVVKKERVRREEFSGRVWCISTPYETFYTRRNGKVFLSGNSRHMLLIYEEMPGIPESVLTAGENTSTAPHNLRLGLGNPDSQHDTLHTFCTTPGVRHVRISALDHPNVVAGDPDIVPGAVSQVAIDRRRERYGEGSIIFQSRVRGMSPTQATDSLIKWEWCVEAAKRYSDEEFRRPEVKSLGVDVANSESGDKAAISRWLGACLLEVDAFPCPDSNQLGLQVAVEMAVGNISPMNVGVDSIGVGAGTVNKLKEVRQYIRALNGASRPEWNLALEEDGQEPVGDSTRYLNLRAQMWWQLREDLQHGRVALPDDEELFRELTTPTWTIKNGAIRIESKEDIRKRLGNSPNKADAVVYGNWVRERVRSPKGEYQVSAWDPGVLAHEADSSRRISVTPAGSKAPVHPEIGEL